MACWDARSWVSTRCQCRSKTRSYCTKSARSILFGVTPSLDKATNFIYYIRSLENTDRFRELFTGLFTIYTHGTLRRCKGGQGGLRFHTNTANFARFEYSSFHCIDDFAFIKSEWFDRNPRRC